MRHMLVLALFLGRLSLPLAFAFDDSEGFRGRVRNVNAPGRSIVIDAKIEGYGDSTSVSVGIESLKDEDGGAVPLSELSRGDEVFVKYRGGFLESLPLQLMQKAPVILLVPSMSGKISQLKPSWITIGTGMESLIVRTTTATVMPDRPLQVGDEIVARYDGMVLESMPPQITASKISIKAPRRKPGFEARVVDAHASSGRLNLVVEGSLPGYGNTQVSIAVKKLVNSQGVDVPWSAAGAGTLVFVEYDGGFLESYPLQLERAVRVIIR